MSEAQLYIELFHGRTDPKQDMDDWGDQGPVFGPFKFVHTTYAHHLKLGLPDALAAEKRREVYDLIISEDDLIHYGGMYFGDWSVFGEDIFQNSPELQERLVQFDQQKIYLPATAEEASHVR